MRQTVKRTCLRIICQYLPHLCCSLSWYREWAEIYILKHKSRSTMRQRLVGLLTWIPSNYTRSFSGQKMNSVPLFSFSENSTSSDSFRALVASPPVFSAAIADPFSIKNTFQFQNQFHSTPMLARLPSKIECQASSQFFYSPLIQGTRLYNE